MADSDWTSLEELLGSSGRPGHDQMLLVARWVTATLADGHRQGAVHGGLSPRTIGLDLGPDGSPTRASIRPPDEDGDLVWVYTAPEVVRGAAPDAAADVFSCGAVLWQCLTGDTPRPGSPPHVEGSGPLATTLRAMLAETPAGRPTAAQAGDLLVVNRADEGRREPPSEPRSSRGRSRGFVGTLSVAVLLLGLSVLGRVAWQIVQDDPPGTPAASSASAPPAPTGTATDEQHEGNGEDEVPTTTPVDLPAPGSETSSPPPTEPDESQSTSRRLSLPAAAQLCEDGLDEPYPQVWAGNEVTSCPFSVNVRVAYVEQEDTGHDVEVVADSPVTGRTYTMTCEDTAPVRCTGGNAAIVYFGDA